MNDRPAAAQELGYCRYCLANVRQRRFVRTACGRWLDRITFGLGRYLGIGTWFCISCGAPRWLFPAYRKEVGDYDPRRSSSSEQSPAEAERVGNLLERQQSLVTRALRRQQYTTAFRTQVVESLLQGETSFSLMRQRLDLSELDLQDWIAEYHREQLAAAHGLDSQESVLEGSVIRTPRDPAED